MTQTKSGFETVPLNGVINATDENWSKYYNVLTSTTASPYMIVKTAAGDFNHDGYENEVAMLTVDKKGVNLCVYQINCEDDNFTIKTMSDLGRVYSFSYPDYLTKWNYNGWNRMPGAEILTGDFDGDSKTDIGVVFQGDISSGSRDLRYYGGTVGGLFTYLYKWNNDTGGFDSQTHNTGGIYSSRWYRDPVRNEYSSLNDANVTIRMTHKVMPWGGIKASTADIDGDGRDEIVFGGYESELREELDVYARTTPYGSSSWYTALACYYIQPVMGLIKIDSDGKLKPLSDYVWKGRAILSRVFERGNA